MLHNLLAHQADTMYAIISKQLYLWQYIDNDMQASQLVTLAY